MQKQPFLKKILKNWKEDNFMFAKTNKIDFAAKEVKYHGWCQAKYQTEAESIFQRENSKTSNDACCTHSEIYYEQHKERAVHSEAFDAFGNFIEV